MTCCNEGMTEPISNGGRKRTGITQVEIKKSYQADLEHRRLTGFLLGLVLALSLLYVGLEWTTSSTSDGEDTTITDDMSQDVEMMPAMDTHDMIAAAPPSAAHAVTERVKAVEHATAIAQQISPNSGDMTQGIGGQSTRINEQDGGENTAAQSPVAVNEDDNPLHFRIVEQLPEYPGGMVAFMKWITSNLRYPLMAQRQHIEGKVVVSFIINKDGSISGAKVEHSVNPLLDQEALRVVRLMPKWKPGLEKNKPCRTLFAIPINFKL